MARSKSKTAQPLTTAQRLGSLVKSARDIMRKDKGLNGDLDRLPMLTWLLFLKFLDDHEVIREDRAKMKKEKYRPVIDCECLRKDREALLTFYAFPAGHWKHVRSTNPMESTVILCFKTSHQVALQNQPAS